MTDVKKLPEWQEWRENAAKQIYRTFRISQKYPEDWPTWGELEAQGHQGMHKLEDYRDQAAMALHAVAPLIFAAGREAERKEARGRVLQRRSEYHGPSFDAQMCRQGIDAALTALGK